MTTEAALRFNHLTGDHRRILAALIRDNEGLPHMDLARLFADRAGRTIDYATVRYHRRKAGEAAPSRPAPGRPLSNAELAERIAAASEAKYLELGPKGSVPARIPGSRYRPQRH